MRDEQSRIHAGDVDAHAVDTRDAHLAATQALAAHLRLGAPVIDHVDVDRVGVDGPVVPCDGEAVFHAVFIGQLECIFYALVVGVEPQNAGNQCAVRTVAAIRVGKAVPQGKVRLDDAPFK